MLTVTQIPKNWLAFLQLLRLSGFPDAVITGGALRDLDNGRPIKDIDIFVTGDGPSVEDRLYRMFGRGRVYEELSATKAEYFAGEVGGIYSVEWRDIDFSIIALQDCPSAAHAALRNDFGICQISTDGRTVHCTDAYREDRANKTFTLCRCRCEKEYERSMRRWKRLQEKYSDWTLQVPEEHFEKRNPV